MNHLAHLALAAPDAALMTGGLLGDFVKGPLRGEHASRIELGIRLHRAIDAETARDDDIRLSIERFGAPLRRLAPILVDIAGDHLLASSFAVHHGQSLATFARSAYAALREHRTALGAAAAHYAERLETLDLLSAYEGLAIVERGFTRIATRLRQPQRAAPAMQMLITALPELAQDFARYYPRLQVFARDWLARESVVSADTSARSTR